MLRGACNCYKHLSIIMLVKEPRGSSSFSLYSEEGCTQHSEFFRVFGLFNALIIIKINNNNNNNNSMIY